MRVAYFVQTHRAPAQILRLLATLRRGSPQAPLVVGHCPSGEPLDEDALARLGALVFRPERPARRGYWSILEPYFAAVELLERRGVAYDWLVYLSGQDYPVQPLAASEARLAASGHDGYLTFRPAEAVSDEGRRRQGRRRYFYRYRDLPRAEPLLRILRRLNGVQPWWHVHLTYGPRLGVRTRRTPFGPDLRPYVGSQWTTLRRACALRVLAAARAETALVEHFARTVCPDEAFVQTVLVAEPRFRLANDSLRYVDVRGSRDGRPRVLGRADGPALVGGGFAFARKFDAEVDAIVLDWLDNEVLGTA
ncbi:MAG TPA: beta-1,6-N-acetylglucosaminyltransferase [Thermoanaerobaculia bacterium]|nr:beta-1,6-N-acetylglucosaminyltransferase [Thermoanaerobaculia bacterium]